MTATSPAASCSPMPRVTLSGCCKTFYASLISANNNGQAVGQVNRALTEVGVQSVAYGNALNHIDLTQNFLNQDKINLSSQENTLVGANPAKAATDFAQAQLANQSTISATGRVLRLPTLLDFIK
jgi:flagellin-like hook-associated protein FlgL